VIFGRLRSERINEIPLYFRAVSRMFQRSGAFDTAEEPCTAVTFKNGPVSGTSSSPREIKGGDGLKDAGNTDRPTNIKPVLRTKGVYP
ncbi:MAG: hypothetical protein WCI75_19565, partial [candidate division NC10 bacterium]